MSNQRGLFDPDRAPMARETDPLPSHAAADEVEGSGKASTYRLRILRAIDRHPARNARELAPLAGLEYAAMSKRLSELHDRGLIQHGLLTERARRWFISKKGVEVLGDDRWQDE